MEERLVVSRERMLARAVSPERTLARKFTSPLVRLRTVARLVSLLIATLGCRFLMIVVRPSGSDATNRLLIFFLITTPDGSLSTPTTRWARLRLMKTSSLPPPLTPTRTCERVWIASRLRWVPIPTVVRVRSDRLPAERTLAERMRVSRATLREALRTMQLRGLIVSRRGAGNFIAVGKPEDLAEALHHLALQDIFELRLLIEPSIAALAADRANRQDLLRMESILQEQEQEVSTKRLAAQTVMGSAKLLLETDEHPGRLKDMVTSPGGTAIAGLHTLEEGGLRTTLINAVETATKRARELGRGQK